MRDRDKHPPGTSQTLPSAQVTSSGAIRTASHVENPPAGPE
jgi:hypothetical protein